MSAKWIRAKRWDDEHLTGALLPVKWVLRTLSGIPLAVVLLTLVALYGILASVPIGLIALAPTYIIYGATALLTLLLLGVLPAWLLARALRRTALGSAARFAIVMAASIALAASAVTLWALLAWPHLRYDPATGGGLRLFGSFVDTYRSVQFRRLPMMEMSELEFYSWWPLRLVLILFVVNMVVATVRRIEFSFPYIGVLTVHSGIVAIALGSVYYAAHKQEGDMILLAGGVDEQTGAPLPGPPETGFYDNTDVALWVSQRPDQGWEQRRLEGVPRYNDYNLNALGLKGIPPMALGDTPDRGPLNIRVPDGPRSGSSAVDPDVAFRIVGYASHADLITQWMPAADAGLAATGPAATIRSVEAYLDLPADPNDPQAADPSRPRKVWRLVPDQPTQRVDVLAVDGIDLLGLEYTRGERAGMPEQRWRDLSVSLPAGTRHALVVRHKASGFEQVYPVNMGSIVEVASTGYRLEVVQLMPNPPFPIITRGYQGARSSVAVVRVTPPPAEAGAERSPAFERWVYHRFPEISQDLVDAPEGSAGGGMRRAADTDLEIAYVDASILQIYLDEQEDGTVRALVRLPSGEAAVTPAVAPGGFVEVAAGLRLKLGERADEAVRVEFPFSTPSHQRETRAIGNHQRAAIAVEVTATITRGDKSEPYRRMLWVPFTQYARIQGDEGQRTVTLPDGRRISIVFGRVRHEFWPPMMLRLADFEMIPYPHSTTPRDYRSELIVMRRWAHRHEDVRRKTSLNEPLLERTPFQPRADAPWVVNAAAKLLSLIAPNQYKFSQAGWDQEGWMQSLEATQRGEARRPTARFTILGVGNNPGIYIIATGAVMMSVGIPWAFYVKPWLMRRRKRRLQDKIARGEIAVGTARRPAPAEPALNGDASPAPHQVEENT